MSATVVELGKALKVCSSGSCAQHSGMASEPERGVAERPTKDPWPGHKGESLSGWLRRQRRVREPPKNIRGTGSGDCLRPSLPGQLCCHVFCTVSAAVLVPSAVSISSLGPAPGRSSGEPAQLACLLMLHSPKH